MDSLLEGPLLKDCRLELELAGHSCVLQGSFAKIFVRPHQWDAVMDELAGLDLQRTHVIVADEFEHLLNATVNQIRSKSRPKVKTRTLLTIEEFGKSLMSLSEHRPCLDAARALPKAAPPQPLAGAAGPAGDPAGAARSDDERAAPVEQKEGVD